MVVVVVVVVEGRGQGQFESEEEEMEVCEEEGHQHSFLLRHAFLFQMPLSPHLLHNRQRRLRRRQWQNSNHLGAKLN